MPTRTSPPWECSLAYEQHYAEQRSRIANLLEEWGSTTNSKWPEQARFIRIGQPKLTTDWVQQVIQLGRASIELHIPGYTLTKLFPQLAWHEWVHDVYFTEVSDGNVKYDGVNPRRLAAYTFMPDYTRVIELGCDHPNAEVVATGNCFRKYKCPSCEYVWAVDSSG